MAINLKRKLTLEPPNHLLTRLWLTVEKVQGNIFLGHKGTHVTRTGETEMIQIECNEHTLLTSFEVLELQYPFVIGMDLFCNLGSQLEESQMDELMLTCSQSYPIRNQEIYPLRPQQWNSQTV